MSDDTHRVVCYKGVVYGSVTEHVKALAQRQHDISELMREANSLCDAATAGPWEVGYSNAYMRAAVFNTGEGLDAVQAEVGTVAVAMHARYMQDARFIARARTLIPELVTALTEVTARLIDAERALGVKS